MDSKLQIISGMYRGRKLRLPVDARPTQNRARMALFNMLESGVINPVAHFNVWDAFAGSGAFGLECLSRYPNSNVTFTDVAATSVQTVRMNLAVLDVGTRATAVQCDAIAAISSYGATADLVFVDPPYALADLGAAFVRKIGFRAKVGTIVIWEQDTTNSVMPDENVWEILRDKKYGRARFFILRRQGE